MTPEEFRRLGHRVIDWIAEYREGIARHPVMAQVAPGEVRSLPARRSAGASGEHSRRCSPTSTGS